MMYDLKNLKFGTSIKLKTSVDYIIQGMQSCGKAQRVVIHLAVQRRSRDVDFAGQY